MATLWLLGSQCSFRQPWFEEIDKKKDHILLIEARSRSTWQQYHKQKLVLVFSIMRHFKAELEEAGFSVDYRQGDSFEEELQKHINQYKAKEILIHQPSDHRMERQIHSWKNKQKDVDIRMQEEGGFLIGRPEWEDLLPDNQKWQMDKLYRKFRTRFDVLLTNEGKPLGGKWSLDAENRKPPKKGLDFPAPAWPDQTTITKEVIADVEQHYTENYGSIDSFRYPVTADQAEAFLEDFIKHRLPTFGDYQDAMIPKDPFMSHSMLSASINMNLLDPLDVIRRAEEAYEDGHAPLNAVEGFIRQILGWREYIRGIYLRKMPEYRNVNELDHHRDLPDFFWTGETKMHCMQDSIGSVIEHGYSHHIQRLMVIGNFSVLAGFSPQQVSDWFNEMYIDALDWVVLPNVLGMALYADGGLMSTKPYVSSGNYIHKMSRYCGDCEYSVKDKYGETACPFHSLYWDFLERQRSRFEENPRMKVMFKHLDNRSEEQVQQQKETVDLVFDRLKKGEL
ncbi:cryptochrome/photolyase family protein [Alkalicoccus chagannorensis]|uniref:cryptochrome/photolyase family protein n=1 Tax=Alkalicoccus chagannorensis TaxID=427072 RepID=UPI00042053C9|nr:cryptochrome/photolyase family protein [Alkalicoccus chagannorensis]